MQSNKMTTNVTSDIFARLISSGVYLWDHNCDHNTYRYSEEFCSFFGIPNKELTISDILDYIHTDYSPKSNSLASDELVILPFKANNNIVWVEFSSVSKYIDEAGCKHRCGTAKVLKNSSDIDNAKQSGIAIESVSKLLQTLTIMSSKVRFSQGIHMLLRELHKNVPSVRTGVLKWESGKEFSIVDIVGGTLYDAQKDPLSKGSVVSSPLLQQVCTSGITFSCNDISTIDKAWGLEKSFLVEHHQSALLIAPIKIGEMVYGIIGIVNYSKNIWTPLDLKWVEVLANSIALCLMQTQQNEALEHQLELNYEACRTLGITTWQMDCATWERKDYIYIDGEVRETIVTKEDLINDIHPDDLERYKNLVESLISRKTSNVIARIRSLNFRKREMHWYEVTGRVVEMDDNGVPTLIVGIARDIDAEVKKQEMEKHAHEMQNTVYNSLPAGIEFFDIHGNPTFINNHIYDIYGVGSEEREAFSKLNLFKYPLLSEKDKQLISSSDKCELYFRLENAEPNPFSPKKIKKDPTEIAMRISKLYLNDIFTGYMTVVIDNSDIMIQRRKLEIFETYFSEIGHVAKVGISFSANDQEFASEQWNRNFGIDATAPVARHVLEYTNIHHEDLAVLGELYDKLITGNVNSSQHTVRVLQQDGMQHWVKISCVRSKSGNGITGINIDVTERKETEQMLVTARKKAEKTDLLKSRFVANISHQIRTPLNAIVGFSELLMDTQNEDQRRQYSEIIHCNNDLLIKLVSDILDLSQIESGSLSWNYKMVNVNSLCYKLHSKYAKQVPAGVDFIYYPSLSYIDIQAYCDELRVLQILNNFITNAFKFTEKGRVLLWYEVVNKKLIFHVSDTGKGIPEEKLNTIFDTFVKLDLYSVGTGLGLPICYGLAQQMGGQVGVKSEVKEGSHFWLSIPFIESNEVARLSATSSSNDDDDNKEWWEEGESNVNIKAIIQRHRTVIVLEDDADTMLYLSNAIDKMDVMQASADEFITFWLEKKPLLTIIDIRSCSDVAEEIIQCIRACGDEYKIIALNDSSTMISEEHLMTIGTDSVLQMPMSLIRLKAEIDYYSNSNI